ncbi:MAG TPA: phosphate signaling complex protein PhoU [Gemmatimonadaceae bacterium]|nr:phosphate signaling complex protein PhoU [Gemmatimonadaceae bacterium]
MTAEATVSTASGFRHFHDQLDSLKEQLLLMSSKAEERTDLAVEALMTRDTEKANLVIEGDKDINVLEVEVEHAAVGLLALQQPMARDLRFIIGAIKVSNDLERVGDHAVNIAESAIRLANEPRANISVPEIEVMARRARKMLGDSLDAFIRADGALGRKVCLDDDVVDSLHDSVFRVLLTHMMADAKTITPSLELLLVGRNLERIADLATNIGEDAVYLAEGKQIKHHREDSGIESTTRARMR